MRFRPIFLATLILLSFASCRKVDVPTPEPSVAPSVNPEPIATSEPAEPSEPSEPSHTPDPLLSPIPAPTPAPIPTPSSTPSPAVVGTARVLLLSGAVIEFGQIPINVTIARLAQFKNTGTASARLRKVAPSSPFTVVQDSCPVDLQPGQMCAVVVSFAPKAIGAVTGSFQLDYSAAAGAEGTGILAVQLNGMGTGLPGSPDATFGQGGVSTPFSPQSGENANAYGRAGAVQADGKVLVAGTIGAEIRVARLMPDGSVDRTFRAPSGYVAIPLALGSSGLAVAVQEDQKILVGFTVRPTATTTEIVVRRYREDGSLDTEFGDDEDGDGLGSGWSRTSIGAKYAGVTKFLTLPGGAFLIGGYLLNDNGTSANLLDDHEDFAVMKFSANGAPDGSFGRGGVARIDLAGGSRDLLRDCALAPNGKILAVGSKYVMGVGYQYAMIRLNSDGSLDPTLRGTGILLHDSNTWVLEWAGVALTPDGKIVVAGSKYYSGAGPANMVIHGFDASGNLNAGFGNGGTVSPWFPTQDPPRDFGRAIAVDRLGRIVVAGNTFRACANSYSGIDVAVVRYLPNGSVDPTFGQTRGCDGTTRIDHVQAGYVGMSQDYVYGMALDALGRVLVFGHTDHDSGGVAGDHDFLVMRFWN